MLHKPILLHLAVAVALGGTILPDHIRENLIINRAGFCVFAGAIPLLLESVKPGNMEFCPCW